jgi:hypothetical protein
MKGSWNKDYTVANCRSRVVVYQGYLPPCMQQYLVVKGRNARPPNSNPMLQEKPEPAKKNTSRRKFMKPVKRPRQRKTGDTCGTKR